MNPKLWNLSAQEVEGGDVFRKNRPIIPSGPGCFEKAGNTKCLDILGAKSQLVRYAGLPKMDADYLNGIKIYRPYNANAMNIRFKTTLKNRLSILGIILFLGCVKDKNFDVMTTECGSELVANTTFTQLKGMYLDGTVQILEELIIEGYVVSSDEAGNFFGILHFQDTPTNPTEGLQIAIDTRESHLLYPVGTKILVKLNGLYLGKSKDVFKLGGVFTSFGNESVGPLPSNLVDQHIVVACTPKTVVEPVDISIGDMTEDRINTLVRLQDVEILEEELGLFFAMPGEETQRTLTDCTDNTLILLNSGYADFQADPLPLGRGTITGILLWEKGKYRLVIRNLEDIDFGKERCEDFVDEFTSNQLFISELADPDNNTKARFVELYNAASTILSLKGWQLRRYTNANIEPGSIIDLTGNTVDAESTFVIAANAAEFEAVYGFAPDLGIGTNTPADSNGDDNLELVDPFGIPIDVFGVIGEDGTGTNHEFEDGRAIRNPDIVKGNPSYEFDEWILYNDSGDAGTIQLPQNAPTDFTPGARN